MPFQLPEVPLRVKVIRWEKLVLLATSLPLIVNEVPEANLAVVPGVTVRVLPDISVTFPPIFSAVSPERSSHHESSVNVPDEKLRTISAVMLFPD